MQETQDTQVQSWSLGRSFEESLHSPPIFFAWKPHGQRNCPKQDTDTRSHSLSRTQLSTQAGSYLFDDISHIHPFRPCLIPIACRGLDVNWGPFLKSQGGVVYLCMRKKRVNKHRKNIPYHTQRHTQYKGKGTLYKQKFCRSFIYNLQKLPFST